MCLASVNFGLLFAWSSPYIPYLISNTSHIQIHFEDTPYLTILSQTATLISAPLFSPIVDIIGRRNAITFTTIPYLTSWIMITFAKTPVLLYASRIASGIGDAACFTVIPIYVGEIAEPRVRGTWGNLFTVNVYTGQFIINTVGSFWDMRTTAVVFAIIPMIHIMASRFLPESPYYLIMKGKESEAVASLRKLRWKQDVQKELETLKEVVRKQTQESGGFLDLFATPSNRRACFITVGNRLLQLFSGLPAFSFYTQYIFQQSGGDISKSTSSIIFTGTLLITVIIISGFALERFGRRPAMITSSSICALCLAVEAIYFYIDENNLADTSRLKWIPLAGLVSFVIACSLGLGLVPSLMLSELFPASVKAKAMCLNNITFALGIITVAKIFQLLTSNFGLFVPFTFFCSCCIVAVMFSYFCIVETKGKTLDEIQHSLGSGKT